MAMLKMQLLRGGQDVMLRAPFFLAVSALPFVRSHPLYPLYSSMETSEQPLDAANATLWIYLAVACILVLLGGVFAGLTIALMGQVPLSDCLMSMQSADPSSRMKSTCKS